MIAPEAHMSKRAWDAKSTGNYRSHSGCVILGRRNHGLVKQIIMRPYFGPPRAKLGCDITDCCLRARFGSRSGFLSPPAPRGVDGPGQEFFA